MRKIKLQVQLSIDGFIAGQKGEMDWLTWNWDVGIKACVNELTESVDTILLGGKMAHGFIDHWSALLEHPDDQNYEFAKKMIGTSKIVFSRSMKETTWQNTKIARGDLADEILSVKSGTGKDVIVYGGATFDSALIAEGLIDQYYLFINPAILGSGLSIFNTVKSRQSLKLVKSVAFDCGIVLLRYDRA